MGSVTEAYERWLCELDEDVIQREFGYEHGEFTVYPSEWRPLFDEGLTPHQAWQRALDAHKVARDEEDRLNAENWERIQREDLAAVARAKKVSA